MLGYAFQQGLLPLALESLLRAIELNGVAVDATKRAFLWGRFAAADPVAFSHAFPDATHDAKKPPQTLLELIDLHAHHLAAYQDENYARRYRARVEAVAEAERFVVPGRQDLACAVARGLSKLMAAKDEYEVARLYTDGRFAEKLADVFESKAGMEIHLAPPFLARRDPATGRPYKRAYGPWILPVLRVLPRLRWLRGTRLDPFSYSAERRMERGLIADYEALLQTIVSFLTPANHAIAVELALLPEQIRGFGPVKEKNLRAVRSRERDLLERYQQAANTSAEEKVA
jgi:indolepyruvate ferredoxin oxidoreductase